MPSVDLTQGEADFAIDFNMINETTGSAFDLTDFTSRLFIKTTDFLTDQIPGGVVLIPLPPPTDGILEWQVQAAHIPTVAGQYYGMIVHTNGITGEIRKSRRFDVRVERKLD
ncbi:hypothetical protein KAR91_03425 [Candidatus Pacearchaeota archaeon]|nr:hypothetical protein [Candidatus Pacearchaeota archaeon]